MHSTTYTSNGTRLTVKHCGSRGEGTAGSALQQTDQQQRNSHRKWYLHRFTAFGCWSRFGLRFHIIWDIDIRFRFRSFHIIQHAYFYICLIPGGFLSTCFLFSRRNSIRIYDPVIVHTKSSHRQQERTSRICGSFDTVSVGNHIYQDDEITQNPYHRHPITSKQPFHDDNPRSFR